ncbi:MAG TPA: adenine phosphoribosyltransferase [Nanoarchaeota archaeon]|nr:adenine phosphoribosyltransferase [Nanoarchaeota archaeon]HIH62856.1 adenine phosphoribosyltransferase [Nanoarchaeota archaeon]HIJ10273.1 adenine phosphoribosyltransferase [Nanoarchaeota archaeon]
MKKDLEFIRDEIRDVPDFPKPGILFKDVTTLFQSPKAMRKVIKILLRRYKNQEIDVIAGIEARGFIVGAILANRLGKPFVPIRKKGKLPYRTVSQTYILEYGTDAIEMHMDAILPGQKVLIVDDLIATGGTALAACLLVEKLGGKVAECNFIIDLPDLKGSKKLQLQGYSVFSVVDFPGVS